MEEVSQRQIGGECEVGGGDRKGVGLIDCGIQRELDALDEVEGYGVFESAVMSVSGRSQIWVLGTGLT